MKISKLLVSLLMTIKRLMRSNDHIPKAIPQNNVYQYVIEEEFDLVDTNNPSTIAKTIAEESLKHQARSKNKLCRFAGGCGRFAQGGTKLCISHGGGRICNFEGCKKSAQGVQGSFCIAHGGGKRCISPGCKTSARGSSGFCVNHGGGYKCQYKDGNDVGCLKVAQRPSDFCIAHGGGKRCCVPDCGAIRRRDHPFYCKIHALGHS